MEKDELVANISKKANISKEQAELAVKEVTASPLISKGELAGIRDNNCTNNCKRPTAEMESHTTPIK